MFLLDSWGADSMLAPLGTPVTLSQVVVSLGYRIETRSDIFLPDLPDFQQQSRSGNHGASVRRGEPGNDRFVPACQLHGKWAS